MYCDGIIHTLFSRLLNTCLGPLLSPNENTIAEQEIYQSIRWLNHLSSVPRVQFRKGISSSSLLPYGRAHRRIPRTHSNLPSETRLIRLNQSVTYHAHTPHVASTQPCHFATLAVLTLRVSFTYLCYVYYTPASFHQYKFGDARLVFSIALAELHNRREGLCFMRQCYDCFRTVAPFQLPHRLHSFFPWVA